MPNYSTSKTLIVALGVCLVCSVFVSTAAVGLKSRQDNNRELDKLRNILIAGDLFEKGTDVKKTFSERIRPQLVDLESGHALSESEYTDFLNPEAFDIKAAAKNPATNRTLSQDEDRAGIKTMPRFMPVYKVMDRDSMRKLILPVYGKGLWSTMYGFIALDQDLKTIKGFTFYEHGETPGLGGEVDNPNWKRLWVGKKAFGDAWDLKITVIKGKVAEDDPDAQYKVDGLSGSTLTTRGIDVLVRFWMGEHGYQPFLEKLATAQNPA
jgi:Na+-transporting NADH:ubiquinone oxidoreductase subunit C